MHLRPQQLQVRLGLLHCPAAGEAPALRKPAESAAFKRRS